ncbi:MAG: hypothetical protein ACJ797_08775 [Ktedonobacteraceae bacterium]
MDVQSSSCGGHVHTFLRDKLDQGFSRPPMKTVRGVGYKIKA